MSKQVYTITIEHEEDGSKTMTRKNDGFNSIELLGILELTQQDIIKQLKELEESKIDFVKREVVED
jgi:hypothetical protein